MHAIAKPRLVLVKASPLQRTSLCPCCPCLELPSLVLKHKDIIDYYAGGCLISLDHQRVHVSVALVTTTSSGQNYLSSMYLITSFEKQYHEHNPFDRIIGLVLNKYKIRDNIRVRFSIVSHGWQSSTSKKPWGCKQGCLHQIPFKQVVPTCRC